MTARSLPAAEVRPVRLQLSRKKGFDLQAVSRAINGLPAIKVSRPGRWGNPFCVVPHFEPVRSINGFYIAVPTAEDAVACFREMIQLPEQAAQVEAARRELRGHNLACWCAPDQQCHADVLLELANPLPVAEGMA